MLNLKPFRQKPSLCGAASLKMVLEYFGVKRTEAELGKLAGGTSGEKLLKAVKKLGFRGFVKDFAEIKDIRKYVLVKKIPVIVDWFSNDDGHYSPVAHIDRENIYLQDPELGHMRAIKLETFKRVWFDFPGRFLKSKSQLNLRRMIVIYPPH